MGNGFVLNTATKILAFSAGFVQLNKYKPLRTLRTRRVICNGFELKVVTESLACSAVNKIKPRRTPRTQRRLRKVEQVVFTKPFAISAILAAKLKIKPQRFLAVSASLFYTERDKRRRNDEKIF